MTLTGLVIAQNEERDLPACLEGLAFCDELVVVDGGSRDRTVEIAKDFGARVLSQPWPGYAAQRRNGLEAAACDWILAVDADEVVDAELRAAVLQALKSPLAAAYRVRMQNWLLGKRLRFGGAGDDQHVRLVRRDNVAVTPTLVHEGFTVRGPIDTLPGSLIHQSYADLADFAQKIDRYSSLGAVDAFARGRRLSRSLAAARLPFAFFKRYLLQAGFLDGYPGFAYAVLRAYGDFLKGAKVRELMEKM